MCTFNVLTGSLYITLSGVPKVAEEEDLWLELKCACGGVLLWFHNLLQLVPFPHHAGKEEYLEDPNKATPAKEKKVVVTFEEKLAIECSSEATSHRTRTRSATELSDPEKCLICQ